MAQPAESPSDQFEMQQQQQQQQQQQGAAVRDKCCSVQERNNPVNHNILGAVFLLTATGMSVIGGFSSALVMAKRKDAAAFHKGADLSSALESGGSLAMRALGRATLYAVGGFGTFLFCAWHALGLKDIKELKPKLKSILPPLPGPKSTGRTEFSSFRELMQYLIDEGKND